MSFGIKKLYFTILLLIFFSLFVSSCKRSEGSDNTESAGSNSAVETEEAGTLVFGSARENTTSPIVGEAEKKSFTETDQGDIKGQMFPINSVSIIPEDMIIGALEDFNIPDIQNGSFINSIVAFFNGTMKGEISEDTLHPTWSGGIIRLYQDSISEINYTVRIGSIIDKDGIKTANIRLISDKGRVSGNIMADNYNGKWLLSAVSVDIDQMENVYFRENQEFNPISYSNILLNY